jgi:hypothetical protein
MAPQKPSPARNENSHIGNPRQQSRYTLKDTLIRLLLFSQSLQLFHQEYPSRDLIQLELLFPIRISLQPRLLRFV